MKTKGMSHQLTALRAMNGKDAFALFMEQGTGKCLNSDANVMTPTGWRRIGDLKVGDAIFAANGERTRVTGVFPQGLKPLFRLTFNDHTTAECCDEHLWKVSTPSTRMAVFKGKRESIYTILPLSEFRESLRDNAGNCRYSIPLSGELQFKKQSISAIPPYTLGVLLGDGCLRKQVHFTNSNQQVIDAVQVEIPDELHLRSKGKEHSIIGGNAYKNALKDCGLFGLLSYEKFVPDCYKWNVSQIRLGVLQGLLDTDGTVENGTAVYCSTSERLAEDIADIVRSFGGVARVKRRTNCGYTKNGERTKTRDGFIVRIKLPPHIKPFTLPRKADLYVPHTKYAPRNKWLQTVEPIGERQCVCIAIEHPSHLYITDGFNVTHNTWTFLADAERMAAAGKIDAMLIIAPKGVHTNWTRREIPQHLETPVIAVAYSSNNTKAQERRLNDLFRPREVGEPLLFRVLSINIDAINTKNGFAVAQKFLNATRAMIVLDESITIKNPHSLRTKSALKLAPLAAMRRIGSGLPVTNSPPDIFAQMEFLESGMLGTTSYRAFVAEYAELLPENHGLMRHIKERTKHKPYAQTPQIVARDDSGRPIWRNLDKLSRLLEPHSFRVLKKDCLDLPDKIYQMRSFQLEPAQRRAYDELEKNLRIELGPEPEPVAALAALSKLRQITSGFLLWRGETHLLPIPENPRAKMFNEMLTELSGSFIVWAKFREEIAQIKVMLDEAEIPWVAYYGGVKDKDRELAVDRFQSGDARAFIGVAQAGGIGLTLTKAETVIYYSNDFNLNTRLQSEDRAHRIGTKHNVVYIDLVAENTKDEDIAESLQAKEWMAARVMGDDRRALDVSQKTLASILTLDDNGI